MKLKNDSVKYQKHFREVFISIIQKFSVTAGLYLAR